MHLMFPVSLHVGPSDCPYPALLGDLQLVIVPMKLAFTCFVCHGQGNQFNHADNCLLPV